MSGCSLVAPGLPSLVNGAVPTFSYNRTNTNYFGFQVTYMSGTATCTYTSPGTTFTPVIYTGKYRTTCDFNTQSSTSSGIYCSNLPVTQLSSGAITVTYIDHSGIKAKNSPSPYTFTIGYSPPPFTTTLFKTTTETITNTQTAVAPFAATTTTAIYTSTATQTNTVSTAEVVTSTQTQYVNSCATPIPSSNSLPASNSSVTSAVTSSSTAVPSPTAISCPGSNYTLVDTPSGTFRVECLVDRVDSDLATVQAFSFYDCIQQCAAYPSCVDVSYVGGSYGGICYLKKDQGYPNPNGNVWGAALYPYTPPSTTVAAPTATRTGEILACPRSDKTYYNTNGRVFYIQCYVDHAGGDLSTAYNTDFAGCMDACATNSKCVDVSFAGGTCYMKSTVTSPQVNGNIWAGVQVGAYGSSTTAITTTPAAAPTAPQTLTVTTTVFGSAYACQCTPAPIIAPYSGPSCPVSDATTVNGTCGSSYLVECGVDRNDNDLKSGSADTFQACLDLCDATSGCVDVSYLGNACYLKSGFGFPNQNPNVWGAKQASGCNPVSNSSVAVPTGPNRKLKLHRKRVAPAEKEKRAPTPQQSYLFVVPDATYVQSTIVTSATITVQTTVTTTSTPPPAGTTTFTSKDVTTITVVITSTQTSTVSPTVTFTTCSTASAISGFS